jgi:hypothetical protein
LSALRFRVPPLLAALAALPVLTFAGCSAEVSVGGGDTEASGEEIAKAIEGDYEDQTGVALTRLTCESVKREVGARFECSGRNARGVQLEIDGRVTGTESDGFDYSWHVAAAVAPGVLYEQALRRELEERGISLTEVRCPLEITLEAGNRVLCEATDTGGVSRRVTLTLTDLDGGFHYSVGDQVEGPAGREPTAPGGGGESSASSS